MSGARWKRPISNNGGVISFFAFAREASMQKMKLTPPKVKNLSNYVPPLRQGITAFTIGPQGPCSPFAFS